ncbi:MAG: TonB-dependent receptor [Burkholderiales bacterium]|nr:TonB-dependent receptor [Burkholderiales bacterium]
MKFQRTPLAIAIFSALSALSQPALAQSQASEPAKLVADTVTIYGSQPTSLPAFIPTSLEGITRQKIESNINATDSEDALKYFPSLLVRKRYVGDYNHAVLSSRASGTGNSARSAVYADGILLSNYLGNGATYTPRWGLVTPEEIERVDVMYGPFSAAYRGNSAGAIVDFVTRMPKSFEAHAKVGFFSQNYDFYNQKATYHGTQVSASLGNKQGDWSWWLNANRLDTEGQPLVFGTRAPRARAPAAIGVAVDGAIGGLGRSNAPGHGLTLKSHTKQTWDWEVAASMYDYGSDKQRSASSAPPAAYSGGAGTLQIQDDTGWNAFSAKAIWRPDGAAKGTHTVEFGVQRENYTLHITKLGLANNWQSDEAGTLQNEVGGKTTSTALYAQDRWLFAPQWQAVLGLRLENWRAEDGYTRFSANNALRYAARDNNYASPKAALSYQWQEDTVFKASIGRAVRMPTVAELYGATATANSQYINDPHLAPEKSVTAEFSLEKDWNNSALRATLFTENVHDSLYSQTIFDAKANANISRVQNVGRIQTNGVEVSYNGKDLFVKGLEISANATYADSRIKENAGFVSKPGDTIDKQQPRVPRWRASSLISYQFSADTSAAFGMRYSSNQYSTLNNSDPNGFAYQGASRYFTTDVRVRHQINKQWSVAGGIDNLNNYQYWNFHPYPQRSYFIELKYDH